MTLLFNILFLSCNSRTELPAPTMQQARAYVKQHPESVVLHMDLEDRNLTFLSVNLPETAQHASDVVHLHKKGYSKIDCYEVPKASRTICLFKENKKCGILHPLTGDELLPAKYDWKSSCKEFKYSRTDTELYLQLGEIWIKVDKNTFTEVSDPFPKQKPSNAEQEQKDKCAKAKKNTLTAKQAQKEFKKSSWKGLPQLEKQLFYQIYCKDKNGDQNRIFSMINDMLQPVFKKQSLKIKVDPSIKGVSATGTLSKCRMYYHAGLGTRFSCTSSIDTDKLEKAAGGEVELVCEKEYTGESYIPYTYTMILSKNEMSVGECFGSGSTYVTVKPAKK